MAATIAEDLDSQRASSDASGKRATRVYRIFGTSDGDTALQLLDSTAPANHAVLTVDVPRARLTIEPEPDTIDTERDVGQWIGTAEYAFPGNTFSPPAASNSYFQFEAQTATERIFRSRRNLARHSAEDDGLATDGATNYGGLINVTDDGVDGVEVLVPKFSFSMQSFIPDATLQAKISTIANSIATVNDDTFQGFSAGEVLFTGASGSRRSDEESWEVNFTFVCSPNRTNIDIDTPLAPSGAITVAAKGGWDYLWTRSVPFNDPDTNRLGTAVEAAYVEEIYDESDYSLLPIY